MIQACNASKWRTWGRRAEIRVSPDNSVKSCLKIKWTSWVRKVLVWRAQTPRSDLQRFINQGKRLKQVGCTCHKSLGSLARLSWNKINTKPKSKSVFRWHPSGGCYMAWTKWVKGGAFFSTLRITFFCLVGRCPGRTPSKSSACSFEFRTALRQRGKGCEWEVAGKQLTLVGGFVSWTFKLKVYQINIYLI